jgi:tetratricopeptide (TPR) repeat protein
MAYLYRSIDAISETLERAKSNKRSCTLLIGAGCSVSAGIPTAAGFVKIINDEYRVAYERASEKTYAKCMGELLLSQRRDLIARYVDNAQINWAHLCIAMLMQGGYVDRVLTTNFDLLVVRACAVLGLFPAAYDFATSQLLKRADIPGQAVFYLHGQRTGFVLMNTMEDLEKHSALLGPVFEDAGAGRVWIVVGYSGDNDPVFSHLARVPRFDSGLYWIGYLDHEPASHVGEELLGLNKDAFFTKGFDADSFFVALTRELKIFPPELVARPFSYVHNALKQITPFTDPRQASTGVADDVMRAPLSWVQIAIAQYENPTWEIISGGTPSFVEGADRAMLQTVAAQYLLMAGKYEQVLTFQNEFDKSPSAELANVLSMAYVMHGNSLLDRAKADVDKAGPFFTKAREMYEAALAVKPNRQEALHNWGNLLLDQAKMKEGEEADLLFDAAEEKYRQALMAGPTQPEVFINWGNLLLERAKAKPGGEGDRFFAAAESKYKEALGLKPDMPSVAINWANMLPSVAINWGNMLLDRAKTKVGFEADRLFILAEAKYEAALAIQPRMHEAYSQWGNMLLDQAKRRTGAEANRLFKAAEGKYMSALAIKPDSYGALSNWGNLLLDRAKRGTGEEADNLFRMARQKYLAALDIKPGALDVLQNLGNLLSDWSTVKTGDEASALRAEAEAAYNQARLLPKSAD